jgi:Kef-type K+ transport system membrane component KefB
VTQTASALTSSVHSTEQILFFMLLQLAAIILAARLAGNLAVRWGNARVVGEIIVGILLGPSLFGQLWPEGFTFAFRSVPSEPVTILSQVGLILLLFQIGLEFQFSHLRVPRNRTAVIRVALLGELVPFALGFAFGQISAPYIFPQGNALGFSLFCGTAFAITALPVLGRILIELDLHRSGLGAIAISAAAINDVVGWLLLAVVSALAVARFSVGDFALKLLMLVAYIAVCVTVIRPLLLHLIRRSRVTATSLPLDLMGFALAAMFLSGMATYKIGIFAIFGGFMLGVLLHDQADFVAAWRERVGDFVNVFFVPIFFTYTGLRTDVALLDGWPMWGWALLLLALATAGKFGGCYWAARRAGMDRSEAKAIGIMMNTRGLMELIVINVGYDLGVIPSSVFTMLVMMAIFSTVITMPALKVWLGMKQPQRIKQGGPA